MDNTYLDIDAIFAEQQKVSCLFEIDVPGLGYLDGGKERDIKKGTKMQLPFWLAVPLLQSSICKFDIPPPFTPRVRHALNAEARSVRLSSLVGVGNYWYAHGRNITEILDDAQANGLKEVLSLTFKQRLMDLMDQAQHFAGAGVGIGVSSTGTGDAGQEFREGLDQTERELFALAQESARRTKAWFDSSDRSTL
ncbi:GINS complex, Psf3 component [Auricularia subglabra TFB-10046 SS5]|nr:GINS complex, Psf3 component [Auricularia subglabra TFB-10046 SS5]